MSNEMKPMEIGIGGMTCAACVRRVENGIRKVPAVIISMSGDIQNIPRVKTCHGSMQSIVSIPQFFGANNFNVHE